MSLLCEAFHSSASKRYSGADQWSLLTQEGDQARRPVPDADGDGRLSGRAPWAPRPARLRELLRPPPPRGRRQDRADPERARQRGRFGVACTTSIATRTRWPTSSGSGRASHGPPPPAGSSASSRRSEEHTSELQSRQYLVCRLLLEKKKTHAVAQNPPQQTLTRN